MADVCVRGSFLLYFSLSSPTNPLKYTHANCILGSGPRNLHGIASRHNRSTLFASPFRSAPNAEISGFLPKGNVSRPSVGYPLISDTNSAQNSGRVGPPSMEFTQSWVTWVIVTSGSSLPLISISSNSGKLQRASGRFLAPNLSWISRTCPFSPPFLSLNQLVTLSRCPSRLRIDHGVSFTLSETPSIERVPSTLPDVVAPFSMPPESYPVVPSDHQTTVAADTVLNQKGRNNSKNKEKNLCWVYVALFGVQATTGSHFILLFLSSTEK